MNRKAVLLSIFSSIAGIILSLISTFQRFRILKNGLVDESYCSISEFINCDLVNASSYSELMGIPIAWLGFMFYLVVLIFSLFLLLSKGERRGTATIVFGMGVLSIIYSIWLAWIAFFVIDAVCMECLAMYAANFLIMLSGFFMLKVKLSDLPKYLYNFVLSVFSRGSLDFKVRIWRHIGVAFVVFLLGFVVIVWISPGEIVSDPAMSTKEKIDAFYKQSIHDFQISDKWAVWGNPNSKVKIVEFSEFQCPYCKISAFNVKPFLQELNNKVAYYFVNYPLDSSCNPNLTNPMHPMACEAARAGICAMQQGKFWPFHDDLFRNAKKLSSRLILDIAKKNGLKIDQLEICMNDPATSDQILEEIKAADKIYVKGTPSIFLNGRKLNNWSDRRLTRALIEEEIRRTR